MLEDYVILCLAALVAGAINAIAGGGTLVTFPALYAALGETASASVLANGTSTVALVPAAIGALAGYRRELAEERYWTMKLLAPSLAGGVIGALAVVLLPPEMFDAAVPWLILIAATLFAFQPRISRWIGLAQATTDAPPSPRVVGGAVAFQFLVGVYGGYFGAGIGILMLAALAMIGLTDIHRMNAVKSLLGLVINGTSVIVFVISDNVHWPFALAMAAASSVGGYAAAHTARKVNRTVVRRLVVTLGFVLAGYYLYGQFAKD
jgi:uncharacterized membrane protein YfcA